MPTAQEEFWGGDFGRDYTARNRVDWKARIPFFRDILQLTDARSVLDIGTNSGWNLRALRRINSMLSLWGIDVNAQAIEEAADAGLSVVNCSLYDLPFQGNFDLVMTSGVLIHVAPKDLKRAMGAIVDASHRYVLAVEYADEKEVEVGYRGHAERLWRRPFGKLYEQHGLKIVAQGDEAEGYDKCAWWLLTK